MIEKDTRTRFNNLRTDAYIAVGTRTPMTQFDLYQEMKKVLVFGRQVEFIMDGWEVKFGHESIVIRGTLIGLNSGMTLFAPYTNQETDMELTKILHDEGYHTYDTNHPEN